MLPIASGKNMTLLNGRRDSLETWAAWIPLDPDGLPDGDSMLVLQSFHLDPTITNFAQSDVMSFTEYFLGNQRGAPLPSTP